MVLEGTPTNPWATVVGAVASDTEDVEVEAPTGKLAFAIGANGAVVGTESGTTDGLYKFDRGTTATELLYFIL